MRSPEPSVLCSVLCASVLRMRRARRRAGDLDVVADSADQILEGMTHHVTKNGVTQSVV